MRRAPDSRLCGFFEVLQHVPCYSTEFVIRYRYMVMGIYM